MPDKISTFIHRADDLRQFRHPFFNAGIVGARKLSYKYFKSFCFELFFKPREPTLFRISIPPMHDKNPSILFHFKFKILFAVSKPLASAPSTIAVSLPSHNASPAKKILLSMGFSNSF